MRRFFIAASVLSMMFVGSCNEVVWGPERPGHRTLPDGLIPRMTWVVDFQVIDESTGQSISTALLLPIYQVSKRAPVDVESELDFPYAQRIARPTVILAGQPVTIIDPPITVRHGRFWGDVFTDFFVLAQGYEIGYFIETEIDVGQRYHRCNVGGPPEVVKGHARLMLKPAHDDGLRRVCELLISRQRMQAEEFPTTSFLYRGQRGPFELRFTELERRVISECLSQPASRPS